MGRGHDGSKRQPKDPSCHRDRATSTKTFEGNAKAEANVSAELLQQAAPGGTTTHEHIVDTKYSNSYEDSKVGSEESSPRDAVLSTKPTVATIDRHKDKVFALAVAGELLYTASDSTDIRLFRAPSFEEVDCFGSGNGMVQSLMAFGDTLYSAHQDNKIRVWKRVRSGGGKCKHKLLAVLPRLDHCVKSMLLERNYVQVRRHKKKLWIEHADTISALALGGSGRSGDELGGDSGWRPPPAVLYSASWDRTVKVWSLSNYKCIESFYAHTDAINAMIVIDGLVLATGSADCSIKLWTRLSPSSRKRRHSLLSTLHGHKAPVNALAISENAKVLYSGGSDGAVIAWKKVYNKPRARSNYHSTIHTTRSGTISSALSGDAFLKQIGSASSGDIEMIKGADCLAKNEIVGVDLSGENSVTKHVAGLIRRGNNQSRAVASGFSFVIRKVMVGHTRSVLSVSTVGDNIVCSSSADKTIRVWRRGTSPESASMQQLHRHSDSGRSVWEYECMAVLAGHGGPVKSIASVLCPTAQHLVCRESLHAIQQDCTAAAGKHDAEGEDDSHVHTDHHNGVVVYSAGLDSKVKVWVVPLQR